MQNQTSGVRLTWTRDEPTVRQLPRADLVQTFVSDSSVWLNRIQASIESHRYQDLRCSADHLREGAVVVGAAALADACTALALAATVEDEDLPFDLVHDLYVHWHLTLAELGADKLAVRH